MNQDGTRIVTVIWIKMRMEIPVMLSPMAASTETSRTCKKTGAKSKLLIYSLVKIVGV